MKKISFIVATLCLILNNVSYADSRCTVRAETPTEPKKISCSHKVKAVNSTWWSTRDVHYQVPLGIAPSEGWPVAVFYQGANTPIEFTMTAQRDPAKVNDIYKTETIQRLLDNGYAVLVPRPYLEGVWTTNILGWYTPYTSTSDYPSLKNLFQAIKDGKFGPLNSNRKYALGMSSGGFNTSRMAVSFPGEFRSLVIHSASYATCLGSMCTIPDTLPQDHPPTFFLHGANDETVPWYTMDRYYDRLLADGVITERYTEATGYDDHRFFETSPQLILDWFQRNP